MTRYHVDPAASCSLVRQLERAGPARAGLKYYGVSELRLVQCGLQVATCSDGQGRSRRGGVTRVEHLWGGRQGGGKSDTVYDTGCRQTRKRACKKCRGVAGRAQIRTRHSSLRYISADCGCCQPTRGWRMQILRDAWDVSKLSLAGYVAWSAA